MPKKDLAKLIKQSGMPLIEISKRVNVARSSIYKILAGNLPVENLSIRTAIGFCNLFNCKLSDLVNDDNYKIAVEFENIIKKEK